MEMIDLANYPILIYDSTLNTPSHVGKITLDGVDALRKKGIAVERCTSPDEIIDILCHNSLVASGIVLDWDTLDDAKVPLGRFLNRIRSISPDIPVFLLTNTHEIEDEVFREEAVRALARIRGEGNTTH